MKSIIQISDSHIVNNGLIRNIDATKRLEQVIKSIPKGIDGLVITGDLTHYGDSTSYVIFDGLLPKNTPIMAIAGNHDNQDKINYNDYLDLGNWHIISANTNKKNTVSGYISKEEIISLNKKLAKLKDKFCLLSIHHPPMTRKNNIEHLLLQNPEELFSLLPLNVKGVIWGHLHEDESFYHNNLHLLSCPSTIGSYDEQQKYGYRKINLYDNGDITTQVIYLD